MFSCIINAFNLSEKARVPKTGDKRAQWARAVKFEVKNYIKNIFKNKI